MLSSGSAADEIAATALGREAKQRSRSGGARTDEAYADWRVELLGMMWAET